MHSGLILKSDSRVVPFYGTGRPSVVRLSSVCRL